MRAATPRGPAVPLLAPVSAVHGPQAGIHPEPSEGLGFPAGRAVADPGQPDQVGVAPEDQVGQGPSGQVGGRDAVAHVATGPGDPGQRS